MENREEKKIEIDQDILRTLNTTRKWTMFLSILGFIGIGVLLIAGVFTGIFLSVFNTADPETGLPGILVFPIVILIVLIYFFPVLYLIRFSKYTSDAIRSLDKLKLHKAFRNLKAFYVYIGILIIAVLVIYVFAFIVFGVSLSFLKDFKVG